MSLVVGLLAGVVIGWAVACGVLTGGFRDPDRLVPLDPSKGARKP